jgi:hypothetical protein
MPRQEFGFSAWTVGCSAVSLKRLEQRTLLEKSRTNREVLEVHNYIWFRYREVSAIFRGG